MKDSRWAFFKRLLRDPATGEIPVDIRQKELEYARTLPHSVHLLRKGWRLPPLPGRKPVRMMSAVVPGHW